MGETRIFHTNGNNPVLRIMNGLELKLNGPKTHPERLVSLRHADEEWNASLDEMLVPYGFHFRCRMNGCVFDDERPEGEMLEEWTSWQKQDNAEFSRMLADFIGTEEGFQFLLAMN